MGADEAAALAGSLGMLPSASLGATQGERTFGVYEPAGGTAEQFLKTYRDEADGWRALIQRAGIKAE